MKTLWNWVRFFLPRIVITEVLFEQGANGRWVPVCLVDDFEPGEYYEKVGVTQSIEWLGMGLTILQERPLRDFNNRSRKRG